MFFQFNGFDRDYNELNCCILEQLQTGKTIYSCYRHACGEVLLCVCSAFEFNGTMFGGGTSRQASGMPRWHKVCGHFLSPFLYMYKNVFGYEHYISQIARGCATPRAVSLFSKYRREEGKTTTKNSCKFHQRNQWGRRRQKSVIKSQPSVLCGKET